MKRSALANRRICELGVCADACGAFTSAPLLTSLAATTIDDELANARCELIQFFPNHNRFISPSHLSSSVCGFDAVDRTCHPSSENSIPASNRNRNLMRDATSWRPRKTSHTLLKHVAVQASALIIRITSRLLFETPNSSLKYSTSKEFGPSRRSTEKMSLPHRLTYVQTAFFAYHFRDHHLLKFEALQIMLP
jgi:hypothetical protein